MQHDIIDNRDRKLADSIKPLLSESERAKFAVGYFFISGFKVIAAELERLKELRLLVGNVSDHQTVEQLAETHTSAQLLERVRKREFANNAERAKAVAEVGQAVRRRIEGLSQTDEDVTAHQPAVAALRPDAGRNQAGGGGREMKVPARRPTIAHRFNGGTSSALRGESRRDDRVSALCSGMFFRPSGGLAVVGLPTTVETVGYSRLPLPGQERAEHDALVGLRSRDWFAIVGPFSMNARIHIPPTEHHPASSPPNPLADPEDWTQPGAPVCSRIFRWEKCSKPIGNRRSFGLRFCRARLFVSLAAACSCLSPESSSAALPPPRRTTVTIAGDEFHINGQPTCAGRTWRGHKIQGLLLNSRMVQGIFDDRNPETVKQWAYPDTGQWDAERNTREFIAAMAEWRRHGLLAFTLNLQGGSPQGYSQNQPWHNSAIEADGSLRADYLGRLDRILDRADKLGMVVILGFFYFGQDQRLQDEAAVLRATDNTTRWILDHGYRNVLIEINNECNVRYDHAILQPKRVHELIERVKNTRREGRRLLMGTSYGGGTVPLENVVRASDFLLMHGNGVSDPNRIAAMVRQARAVPGYVPRPILFNEDDHFDFDKPLNNFVAALSEYASWGYFDFRMKNEGFDEGYQSVPVNWGISSARKRGFFNLLAEVTGAGATAAPSVVRSADEGVSVRRLNYRGWSDSIALSNGKVEVVVVPAIGRVMQFGFIGQDGVFWENRALDGQPQAWNPAEWKTKDWVNFGGDKSWPSPEGDWPKFTQRAAWRPPPAFDGMAVEDVRTTREGGVVLTSPVDPFFGIRVRRTVRLHPDQPVMTISTVFERVSGEPARIGVWVVTQLKHPVGLYVPVPAATIFPKGYALLGKTPPPSLKFGQGLLSLTRNPKVEHKIGSDAGALLWVGEKVMCRIDSPREPGGEYPDQGSSAEIYTNPDPLPYIELEMLGPLRVMKAGDRIERTSIYTFIRRTESNPDAEARRALGLPK